MTPILKSASIFHLHMVIYPVFKTISLATVYYHTNNNEQKITHNHLCIWKWQSVWKIRFWYLHTKT